MDKPDWDKKTIISKAAHFAIGSGVVGPYYEFGVFQGHSMVSAYWAFKYAYSSFLSDYGFLLEDWNRKRFEENWDRMKFVGIDSFEGLPETKSVDQGGAFCAGNYSCSMEEVARNLNTLDVDMDKVELIQGWFKDVELPQSQKASVIHIDCDLYESTVDALSLCTNLVQDGTVLIFDDWFQFKGSPQKGEQKAFYEWLKTLEGTFTAVEYHKEDIWRNSFIMSRL